MRDEWWITPHDQIKSNASWSSMASASASRTSATSPFSASRARVAATDLGEMSSAVTSAPARAISSVCRPMPHPTSNTRLPAIASNGMIRPNGLSLWAKWRAASMKRASISSNHSRENASPAILSFQS